MGSGYAYFEKGRLSKSKTGVAGVKVMQTFLIILVIIETIVIVGFIISMCVKSGSKRAMADNAQQIVGGKLNIEDIPQKGSNGDDAVIANGLNLIKSNLLTFVESTKQNVVVLADSIDSLMESAEKNRRKCENIAEDSREVDSQTANQLRLVDDNLKIIEKNAGQLKEMVNHMDTIADMIANNMAESDNGVTYLEQYEKTMSVVSVNISSIADEINHFNEELQKVYDVGDFIVGISNQLKLLSFNASIEAARAGQFGKGFVVVADEMTKMSEQTRKGMDRINDILHTIIESSSGIASNIEKCMNTYNSSTETFDCVNSSFRTINSQSSEIQDKIDEISVMFEKMSKDTDATRTMADNMCSTAQVINEKTGSIVDSSQKLAAGSATIGESVNSLSGMLAGIQKLLKKFNTGVVPTSKNTSKTIKIAMFSMYDNEFWYNVRRGANYAKQELSGKNVMIDFIPLVPDNRTLDQIVAEEFERVVNESYDGIIYPGFLGGINKYLVNAKAKGIKLMTFNCDSSDKDYRVACLKSDNVMQGQVAGKAAAGILGQGGDVVILMGNPEVSGNVDRNKGFRNVISKNRAYHIINEIVVADDGKDVYEKTCELLSHCKPSVLYLTNGFPYEVAKAIEDSHASGKTKLVAFDLSPQLFPYIKRGIIGSMISQDAFGQGHDPIIWLYNNIAAGDSFPGEYIGCRISVADKNNIDDLLET